MNIDIWHIDAPVHHASRFFAQSILAQTLNLPVQAIEFARGEFGKPYLPSFPQCAFNLSHSRDKMVMAVGFHLRLGIDIEAINEHRRFERLVKKCFSPAEQAYWHTQPLTQQIRLFYEFWTRKEALVKGVGRGIAMGLAQCEMDITCHDKFVALPHDENAMNWHTHLLTTQSNDYCTAIAVNTHPVTFHHKNWADYFPFPST